MECVPAICQPAGRGTQVTGRDVEDPQGLRWGLRLLEMEGGVSVCVV